MFCSKCGTELQYGVCPNCGYMDNSTGNVSQQSQVYTETAQTAQTQPNTNAVHTGQNQYVQQTPYQQPYQRQPHTSPQENVNPQQPMREPDKVNIGFCILAWFCPLFALIYFLVKKSEKPKGTKAVGIVGLVSFILNMIVMIITFAMAGSILNKTFDAIGNVEPGVVIESQWQNDDLSPTENIQSASNGEQVAINGKLDWKNMSVIINHEEIHLPCTYAEFSKKTGYKLAENQSDYLNSNQYTLSLKATNAQGHEMQIRLYNSGDASKPLQECSVIGISVDNWKNNYADVTFPGIIKIGNPFSIEIVTKMFGEPSNTYNGDSGYTTVSWDDNDDLYNEFEIVSKDGKTVSEISVKVFPWE